VEPPHLGSREKEWDGHRSTSVPWPPDGQLVDLGRQLLQVIAEEERILAPYYRLVRFSYPSEVKACLEALAKRQEALRRQIAALPAVTTTGLQAKARAVLLWLVPDGEALVDTDDLDAQLVWSLCRDLLKVASA
jgi:hypothetical protein